MSHPTQASSQVPSDQPPPSPPYEHTTTGDYKKIFCACEVHTDGTFHCGIGRKSATREETRPSRDQAVRRARTTEFIGLSDYPNPTEPTQSLPQNLTTRRSSAASRTSRDSGEAFRREAMKRDDEEFEPTQAGTSLHISGKDGKRRTLQRNKDPIPEASSSAQPATGPSTGKSAVPHFVTGSRHSGSSRHSGGSKHSHDSAHSGARRPKGHNAPEIKQKGTWEAPSDW